jgi:glucose-6-phosphate 1-dehydrogenase
MQNAQPPAPTQIVIFGGSGDLSQRKLLPALFDLFQKNLLPDQFSVIGLARSSRSDDDFRALAQAAIVAAAPGVDEASVANFCEHLTYLAGSFDDLETYTILTKQLQDCETDWGETGNCLFYLAVPPQYYETIFTNLHEIVASDKVGERWARLLVEKPFGKDLETAQTLDRLLSDLFSEEQIYRIDHYLAKEAVQNVLAFRFSNQLFAAAWDNNAIEAVHITMHETMDIGSRGELYDGLGALRDVGQNHLLQLLALTAMRCPGTLSAADISARRAEVLQSLKPLTNITKQCADIVRGQYAGFTDASGVSPDSTTETYFQLRAELNLPEWKGVPFYLSAGKALHQNHVSIRVIFKDTDTGPYHKASSHTAPNEVLLTISPEQEMSVTVNAKAPGLALTLEQRTLHFTCNAPDTEITNSYEKILIDCIYGDKTLFASTEEVLAAWRFISPILTAWEQVPLQSYKPGSQGPDNTLL